MRWRPDLYETFGEVRLRPGLDLLARISVHAAATVCDLGCGAGALIPALRRRWPQARLIGVDLSSEMLGRARELFPDIDLVRADVASWRPATPVDVIFSNAALQWVPDHRSLLPELLRHCRTLAVQLPNHFASPAHGLLLAVARGRGWRDRLGHIDFGVNVLAAADYHALLAPLAAKLELWETIYYHALTGTDPVLEWMRGTALNPFHAALGGADTEDAASFDAEYGARLRTAYPADADGVTLFPFRRLFILAAA